MRITQADCQKCSMGSSSAAGRLRWWLLHQLHNVMLSGFFTACRLPLQAEGLQQSTIDDRRSQQANLTNAIAAKVQETFEALHTEFW